MALPHYFVEKVSYTESDYLERDNVTDRKSEYVRGAIHVMPDCTSIHSSLTVSMSGVLWNGLRMTTRRGYLNIKVRAGDGTLRYPDVIVVDGPPMCHDKGQTILTNPMLLIEVLSPETEATDRGDKLHGYTAIDSLQSYILVSQDAPRIEQYARKEGTHWDYQMVTGADSVIHIPALDITLALADIYEKIDFTTPAPGMKE